MRKVAFCIIFLSLFIGINAHSRNGVSQRDLNMISLAFANGAVEFAKLDVTQMHALKNDTELLREKIVDLTSDYLMQVQKLNSVEKADQTPPGYNYFNH